jgi:hypothetical protein
MDDGSKSRGGNVRLQHIVDEPYYGHEGCLGPVSHQGNEEHCCGRAKSGMVVILVLTNGSTTGNDDVA